jgi:hypothetical protein
MVNLRGAGYFGFLKIFVAHAVNQSSGYAWRYARLKSQNIHMRPMTQLATTMERRIMTMFWNKSKFGDQNTTCSSMKIAQQMPATSVTTIGVNGGASLFVITTRFIV